MAKLSQQSQMRSINSNVTTRKNANAINNLNPTTGGVVKVKRTRKTVPRDSPPQRSSIFRGVTRHRWTGRYEAHLWDKNCWNESQNKKGRQVYLGAYDDEATAAHAYDLAALKYWGHETILNFPLMTYEKELKEMESQSREEYIGSLRRKSSGFSRGVSKFRGVARHHHNGRWEARIGRVFGNKYLYLGTYATQEEAAVAYDMAAIEYRGLNAVTNFDLSRYIKWLRPDSTTPINNISINKTTIDNKQQPNHNIESKNSPTNLIPTPDYINNNMENTNFFLHHQPPAINTTVVATTLVPPQLTTATSALGLLLQSSKFKEMMDQMTTAAEFPVSPREDLNNSDHQPARGCNFPDDVQTYFETSSSHQDLGGGGAEDFIFGDLNSFMQPAMLHAEEY